MNTIRVQNIRRDPSAFLQLLEGRESFLVVRAEQPLVEVRPIAKAAAQLRPFGLCASQFTVPAGFDSPLPDEILRDSGPNLLPPCGGGLGWEVSRQWNQGVVSPPPQPSPTRREGKVR
jgi:hypothetical protein